MWRIWTIVLTLLLVAGVASAAERPACTFDTNGNLIIPDKGVCFLEVNGTVCWFGIGFSDFLFISWDCQKEFVHLNSDGKGQLHFVQSKVQLAYCPPSVIEAGKCDIFAPTPEMWHGTGNIVANGTPGFTCPFTFHVEGDVTSPKGESFKIQAVAVYVPDKTSDWGCRMAKVDEITLRAK